MQGVGVQEVRKGPGRHAGLESGPKNRIDTNFIPENAGKERRGEREEGCDEGSAMRGWWEGGENLPPRQHLE